MPTLWTIPDPPAVSPPELTDAQKALGRDIRFRDGYTVTAASDYGVVEGIEAAIQSVINEAAAPPGSDPFNPDWGMGLELEVKRGSTKADRDRIRNRCLDRLQKNPRISEVTEVTVERSTDGAGTPGLVVTFRFTAGGKPITVGPLTYGGG